MELWIRSQDKECLMKVNRVDYDLSNSKHRIMVNGYETLVGHYETKERALEVLDEIQDKIVINTGYELATNSGIRPDNIKPANYTPVYEMPKD